MHACTASNCTLWPRALQRLAEKQVASNNFRSCNTYLLPGVFSSLRILWINPFLLLYSTVLPVIFFPQFYQKQRNQTDLVTWEFPFACTTCLHETFSLWHGIFSIAWRQICKLGDTLLLRVNVLHIVGESFPLIFVLCQQLQKNRHITQVLPCDFTRIWILGLHIC